MYTISLGPNAVKGSGDERLDLKLFWKSKAAELPELYKLASRYCTARVGSYDVERSFSSYHDILSDKRRSLDESTLKAVHFLNWNLRTKSLVEEERQADSARKANVSKLYKLDPVQDTRSSEGQCKSSIVKDNLEHTNIGEFPRVFMARQQLTKPSSDEVVVSTGSLSAKKRKQRDDSACYEPRIQNRKKMNEPQNTSGFKTMDAFLGATGSTGCGSKQATTSGTSQGSFDGRLKLSPSSKVHHGLNENIAAKLNTSVPYNFPKHKEPLLDSVISGELKFTGNQIIDNRDLESLYGGKANDEDNYLTNFVIEAYLKLIACESSLKGVKVEILGWEEFEKWDKAEHSNSILEGKANLMEQDFILVPVNPGQSKHWTLLVVHPKKKEIVVLDSKASSVTKPSVVNAIAKMLKLIAVEPKLWSLSSNTPEDIPQQQNSYDCGVFVCMFARSLVLGSRLSVRSSSRVFRH